MWKEFFTEKAETSSNDCKLNFTNKDDIESLLVRGRALCEDSATEAFFMQNGPWRLD